MKDEDDKQTSRELGLQSSLPAELMTKQVSTKYNLAVRTSDIKGGGTNVMTGDRVLWRGANSLPLPLYRTQANVFVTLYGERGDTGEVPLKSSQNRNKWERNQVDTFTLEAIDIGAPTKLKVWTDGKGLGAGWHLDSVVVDVPLLGQTVTFPCGKWLAVDEDDGALERILLPEAANAVSYEKKVPFEVVVYTSDVANAGTDANIFMDVYGRTPDGEEHSDSVKFTTANKSSFERGSVDHFNFELKDIGAPYKIRVGHDDKGFGSDWHLDKVVMIQQQTKVAYEFPCAKWLSKSKDDRKVVRELPVSQTLGLDHTGQVKAQVVEQRAVLTYKLSVVTGTVRGAGTDVRGGGAGLPNGKGSNSCLFFFVGRPTCF